MKKILFALITSFFIIGFNNKNSIKANAATIHHIMVNVTATPTYNHVLSTGYYILINESVAFTDEMVIGDAETYCQHEKASITIDNYTDEINVPSQDEDMVQDMLNAYYEYNQISPGVDCWYTNIMFIKVNSYAVFDPNASEDMNHLEGFYAETTAISTDVTISGSKTHLISVDSPLSLDEIKARYTATDAVDGDLTSSLNFISDYDLETLSPRQYYILVSVTDAAGNTTYAADSIIVKDVTAPTISLSKSEVIVEVGEEFTLEDAKKLFTFSDNFSKGEKLKTYILDYYKDQYNTTGSYIVRGRCMDEAGNYSEYLDLSIKVVDTQKPDIFLTNTSNKIISDHVLTDDELKSLFVVTDNYDTIPNTKITIKDNPCDGTQGKDFEIIVTVSDNSGNSCEKTFLYYLTDTEKPIINVSNTIYVEIGTNLTNEQFIDLLKEVGAIPADATSVTIDEEIENGNSTVVNYTTTFSDGTTKTGSITIEYFTRENKNIENIPLLIILSITALTMIGCGLIGFKKKKN